MSQYLLKVAVDAELKLKPDQNRERAKQGSTARSKTECCSLGRSTLEEKKLITVFNGLINARIVCLQLFGFGSGYIVPVKPGVGPQGIRARHVGIGLIHNQLIITGFKTG